MPQVTLDGTVFGATVRQGIDAPTTARRAPQIVTPLEEKAGEVAPARNGYRNLVLHNTTPKRAFDVRWTRVPQGTYDAARLIWLLSTTFTAILPFGTFTVQCHPDSWDAVPDADLRRILNQAWYDITLKLYEP